MTRISKQQRKRRISFRRPTVGGEKTGSKKDQLPKGFREHANAFAEAGGGSSSPSGPAGAFIPKIQ